MKRSKHWADTHKWVKQVVKSAKTPEQRCSALKVIRNWGYQTRNNYPDLDYRLINDLHNELRTLLYEIHTS